MSLKPPKKSDLNKAWMKKKPDRKIKIHPEYHAVWSNQCVELWFLLHFSFMQSDIHRKEYWSKLTDWLTKIGVGEYKKNRTDMYKVLRPFMDFAIVNAKRLDETHQGKPPSKAAPGTKVYELVEMLKLYLPEE